MGLDGGLGQGEPFGDLGIGPAAADRDQDLAFAVGARSLGLSSGATVRVGR